VLLNLRSRSGFRARRAGGDTRFTADSDDTIVGGCVTTPAPEAPLVYPAVAFRPIQLSIVCAAHTALAVALAAWAGHVMFGVFFGVGLGLGLINALLVQRSVAAITAGAHPLKRKMAVNSATRLLIITAVGLTVAWIFRPLGLGVVFGLALFQVVLVLSTALPVWKKIRTGDPDPLPDGETPPAVSYRNPASIADDMFKD
jgi:hypothetical protein